MNVTLIVLFWIGSMLFESEDFSRLNGFTSVESQIFALLISGITNTQQIANLVNSSPYTINNHFQKIFNKLGCNSKSDVLAVFLKYLHRRLEANKILTRLPTLLIVDDDEDCCLMMKEDLSERGFEVHVTTEAANVEGVLRKVKVDIILADIVMPGIDGLELIKLVRAHRGLHPEFIFMSGHPDYSLADALATGAKDFFPKPANIDRLCYSILDLYLDSPYSQSRLKRINCNVSGSINDRYPIQIINLGTGGAFFSNNQEMFTFGIGDQIELTLELEDCSFKGVKAEIVWVREESTPYLTFGYGLKFIDLDEASSDKLKNFVQLRAIVNLLPISTNKRKVSI